MIMDQSVLAIIMARGGSKGLPNKNCLPLKGKPLIAWSIEAAQKCLEIDRVILSTEDQTIKSIAEDYGCEVPFVRPDHLADDIASGTDVIIHALNTLKETYEWLVVLQPTSPLRLSSDISNCFQLCLHHNAPACVSVTEAKSPFWTYFLEDQNQQMRPILGEDNVQLGRQQLPPAFVLNGAVYVARREWFLKKRTFVSQETRAYVMPAERSVDIDTLLDFKLAELLL